LLLLMLLLLFLLSYCCSCCCCVAVFVVILLLLSSSSYLLLLLLLMLLFAAWRRKRVEQLNPVINDDITCQHDCLCFDKKLRRIICTEVCFTFLYIFSSLFSVATMFGFLLITINSTSYGPSSKQSTKVPWNTLVIWCPARNAKAWKNSASF